MLPRPLDTTAEMALSEVIAHASSERQGSNFSVCDTRSIGGSYVGSPRPFLFSVEEHQYEEHELAQIQRAVGWAPRLTLTLVAMCNAREDHAILADLAIALSERAGGLIDLGGDLSLPQRDGSFAISYESVSGQECRFFVVTSEALRRWRDDPAFRMVK
jgi:hypothetical protein